MVYRLLISVFLISGAFSYTFGQKPSATDSLGNPIFKGNVEDILSLGERNAQTLQVTSTSLTAESLEEVGSSITVFSREQIFALGIEDVYDLLNYVPGIQVTRNLATAEEPKIWARGQAANTKILFLINGERLNEGYAARVNLFNRIISVGAIKQVEVIRGTGSALYGSNAFLGVVNIITEDELSEVQLTLGGNDLQLRSQFLLNEVLSDRTTIGIFGEYLQDRGYRYTLNGEDLQDPRNLQSFGLNFRYQNLELEANYQRIRSEDFLLFGRVANGLNQNTTTALQTKIAYNWQKSNKWKISPTVSFRRYSWDLIGVAVPAGAAESSYDFTIGPYLRSQVWGASLDFQLNIKEGQSFAAGASFRQERVPLSGVYTNHLSPDNAFIAPVEDFYLGRIARLDNVSSFQSVEQSVNIAGVYAQYKRQIWEKLSGFVGLRFDYYSNITSTLNPRAGLIYQSSFGSTFKALFGTSFRAPNIDELYTDTPVDIGNVALQPEKIQTFELIWLQKIKKVSTALSLFSNNIESLIEKYFLPDERLSFRNNPENIRTEGLEASISYKNNQKFGFNLNYTYLFSGVALGAFQQFGSAQATYQLSRLGIQLSAIYRPSIEALPSQGAYLIINQGLSYRFSQKVNLRLGIHNLLGQEFRTFSPELDILQNALVNRGRQWRLRLSINLDK